MLGAICAPVPVPVQSACVPSRLPPPPPPLRDIPSGRCFFTGPWTVTRSSLRMLRRVAAFCRPLRPVLPLVSFPRSRSPVVGVPGLCWMWRDVPFVRQQRPPPPPPQRQPRPVKGVGMKLPAFKVVACVGSVAHRQTGGSGSPTPPRATALPEERQRRHF